MRFLVALLTGVVLLMSGCIKVGPDFTPPPATVAESWIDIENPRCAPSRGNMMNGGAFSMTQRSML